MTVQQTDDYLNNGRVRAIVYADQAAGVNPRTTARTLMKAGFFKPGQMGARGAGAGLGTIESRAYPMTAPSGSVFELDDPLDNIVESTAEVKDNPWTPTGRGI